MSLLIVNALPENDPRAVQAIEKLAARVNCYRVIHAYERNIRPCVGCNACWLVTPGVCSIKDDYADVLKAYLQYDETVFLAGTALGFVDHRMKNIIDRILPLMTMYLTMVDGQMRHVPRYDKLCKWGLVYAGEADAVYLNRWMERVMCNARGVSLGAHPIERVEEVLACI